MIKDIQVFYAMEYVNIIGNRILKVWITSERIFAAKVKGMTSETTRYSFINNTSLVVDRRKRNSPQEYANQTEEARYSEVDFNSINSIEFLEMNKGNFIITKTNIEDSYHNPAKKWGMGRYPHNGRIILRLKKESSNNKTKREFILIGKQNKNRILNSINS